MFTEHEIETMVEIPEVHEATAALKKAFIEAEAPYLDISEPDFFSVIMMAPTIGIAVADGKITFWEEMALNKKARKLSKGRFFLAKDPVMHAMKFLIRNYDRWADRCYELLWLTMDKAIEIDGINTTPVKEGEVDDGVYQKEVQNSPYILIRFIASFFLNKDEDIINSRHRTGKREYHKLTGIGEKLGLNRFTVFQLFCKTFT